MLLTVTSSNANGIYVSYLANGDAYVTVAPNASVNISLTGSDTFSTTPSLASVGLSYTLVGTPYISGTPASDGSFTIDVNTSDGVRQLFLTVVAFDNTGIRLEAVSECSCTVLVENTLNSVILDPTISGRGIIENYINTGTEWVHIGTSGVNNNSIAVSLCCYEPGEYQVKGILTIRQVPNCGGTSPIIFQAIYINDYEIVATIPSLTIAANGPYIQTEESCCGIVVGEETIVTPAWVLNRPSPCQIENDDEASVDATITYTLYDSNGALVERTQISIEDGVTAFIDAQYTFTPTQVGDYKIIAEVETCCGSYTSTLILSSCNFVIMTGACHKYKVQNLSLEKTVEINLYKKDGLELIDGYPIELTAGQSYTVEVTDGVYILKVASEEKTFYYPVVDHCGLRECLAKFIHPIICGNEIKGVAGEDARFILNKLTAIGNTYFNMLNTSYGFNNLYNALTPSLIQDLYEVDELLQILIKYCDSNCRQDIEMKGGCGCS